MTIEQQLRDAIMDLVETPELSADSISDEAQQAITRAMDIVSISRANEPLNVPYNKLREAYRKVCSIIGRDPTF